MVDNKIWKGINDSKKVITYCIMSFSIHQNVHLPLQASILLIVYENSVTVPLISEGNNLASSVTIKN